MLFPSGSWVYPSSLPQSQHAISPPFVGRSRAGLLRRLPLHARTSRTLPVIIWPIHGRRTDTRRRLAVVSAPARMQCFRVSAMFTIVTPVRMRHHLLRPRAQDGAPDRVHPSRHLPTIAASVMLLSCAILSRLLLRRRLRD